VREKKGAIKIKTPIMKQLKKTLPSLLAILFLSSFSFVKCEAQVLDSSKTQGPEIKTMYSKILGEKRKIRIQLPSGANAYEAYPVLYVLDGETLTTMVGGQVNYLSESYKIIPNLIIVGIDNTDRMRDLTPTADTVAVPTGKTGGGEKFLQFMKEELMPYIEGRYKTAPYKILAGHSLGGLMALYCLAAHPDYFDGYIAISPSLQWSKNALLKEAPGKLNGYKAPNKFLFFSDANEDAAFHQNQLTFDSILHQKNIAGLEYKRQFYPEETHISEPVKAFYDGIRFIYPNWHLPYNSSAFRKTMNSKIIKDHFEALSKKYGYKVIPLHDEINQIARFLRNDSNRISDAIELLQMNAANYPGSPVVMETMGDSFVKAGDTKKASESYQKALALDPANANLQKKVKDLQ
jgi:predicted alpha/beta superfamily hydrolase